MLMTVLTLMRGPVLVTLLMLILVQHVLKFIALLLI